MGRLLVIVVVLVALALLINRSLIHDGKDKPEGAADDAGAVSSESDPPENRDEQASITTPKTAPPTESPTVVLGSGDLLAGIPGEGSLTAAEVDAWLADPANHVVLTPKLPLGLAAGAAEMQGLEENPLTRAKIELGRQLYFDTRLSRDNTVSCASCHAPELGFAHNTQFGVGIEGQEGNRNSPVAYNRILSAAQFWDGRAASLEAQAVGPIENPVEMGNTHENAVRTVANIAGYAKQFAAIFDDGVTIENIGRALASFERVLVTGPAPWDYYQQLAAFEKAYADDLEYLDELQEEDEALYNEYLALQAASRDHPISDGAVRGGELFFSDQAGCTACHLGANFTDEQYHNLGVGLETAGDDVDWGRYDVTGSDPDRGAFKTPTVRNVALTAPYMHDGSQETLLEVVRWYVQGGHPNEHLSDKITPLQLSEQQQQDLVEFMATGLLGELPPVESGRLPH